MIYETLNIHVTSDSITVVPGATAAHTRVGSGLASHPPPSLVFRRDDPQFNFSTTTTPILFNNSLANDQVITSYGLIGFIHLNSGDHIIIITDKLKIGSLDGKDIWKISAFKIISIVKSKLHLTEQQAKDDEIYLKLLDMTLSAGYFYFSYDYDITNTIQRHAILLKGKGNSPIWEKADDRFFWNKYLLKKLINYSNSQSQSNIDGFMLPIMCGFIEIKHILINSRQPILYSLISRRSQYRSGTRYNSRGIDEKGSVSNYVETEQILILLESENKTSFVQTRGSIPLYWRQIPNVKYTPKLVIDDNPNTHDSCRKHFVDQINRYGNQIIINLINKKGYELKLGDEFARNVGLLEDSRLAYVHFDFHHECKNMKWDRISVLIDQLESDLKNQGYCHLDSGDRPLRVQTSVVRTNCMDCLDRTNVVQSSLARRSLTLQMRELNIITPNEKLEDFAEFESVFRNVWADNANEVSRQYSGTGALKTDFTRTGKRALAGILQDGYNSIGRYIKNNYLDGSRQDAFDLFLGRYEVDSSNVSPYLYLNDGSSDHLMFPLAALSALVMFILTLFIQFATIYHRLFYMVLWISCLIISMQYIIKHGTEYVDKPRLVRTLSPSLQSVDTKKYVINDADSNHARDHHDEKPKLK